MKKQLLFIISLLVITFANAQVTGDFRTTGANTSWNNIATWQRFNGGWVAASAGQIPGTGANTGNVTILDGHTVTLDVVATAGIASLTVGGGTSGTLNIGAFGFTVTGATNISAGAAVTVTSATGVKTFTGNFTNDGTWTNTAANSPITMTGNITNNNTFNAGTTAVYTLSGNGARSINGTITFASITQSVAGGAYTNNGTLTVSVLHTISTATSSFINSGTYSSGGLTISVAGGLFTNNSTATLTGSTFGGLGGFTNAANSTFNWTSTGLGPTTLTATANPNTVNYNNTAAGQTVKAVTYYNLTITKTAQTATVAVFTATNLNIVSGNLNTLSNATTVSGTTTISSAGTFTGAGGAKAFADLTVDGIYNNSSIATISGNLTVNTGSTFTAGGVHTFTGATKTIGGTATSISIPSVTITSPGAYTNNIATLSVGTALIGTGALTMGASTTLDIGGTSTITTLTCTTNTPNTVVYSGTASQSIKLTTYFNLEVNKTLNPATLLAGTTNVNNNLTVTSGTLADLTTASIQMTSGGIFAVANGAVYRTVKITTGAAFFPIGYGTLNFNTTGGFEYFGSATFFIPTTPTTYGRLILSNGGTKTLQAATTVYSLEISNATTLADGGFQITGNSAGTFTMLNTGNLFLGTTSAVTTFPTGFTTANISFATGTTVRYNANSAQTISSVPVYANLELVATSAITKTLDGNTTVLTNVNIGANNTLDIANRTLIATGTNPFTISATGFLDADNAASIIRLNSTTAPQAFSAATARLISGYIYNLEIANSASGSTNLSASTQVINFTVNTGATFSVNNTFVLSVSGAYSNSGSIAAGGTNSTLEFNGTSGVQTVTLGTTTGTPYVRLEVSNASGVTLAGGAATLIGGLDFTTGVLNTTNANIIRIYTTATLGTVTGASNTSYVNGPMERLFPTASYTGTFVYPVGDSGLNSLSLINVVSGSNAVIRADVFDGNSGGSGGSGFTNLATNRYWQATVVSGTLTSVANIQLTETGVSGTVTAIGQNTSGSANGTYNLIGGTIAGNNITSETAINSVLGFFIIGERVPLSGIVQVGPGSTDGFFTFTTATGFFQAVNTRGLSANVTVNVVGNITTEDGAIALNQWLESGAGGYTIKVQSSAAGTPRDIASAAGFAGGLFRLNGADRITFFGGTGAARDLVFRNTNTGTAAATFVFLNDATSNTLQNCTIEGGNSNITTTSGTIYFSTSAAAGTGNDNNVITGCDIRDLSTATAYPFTAILSVGTSGRENSGNSISNCNIYNFYSTSNVSSGIWIASGSSAFTINGNRFYQTAVGTRTSLTEHYVIRVAEALSATTTVSNNIIGYNASDGTGIYTVNTSGGTGRFNAIWAISGTTSITGNSIQAITFNSSSAGAAITPPAFCGIYIAAGNSTISGNTIGSTTSVAAGTNISFGGWGNGVNQAYGIRSLSTGTLSISNNYIGNITLSTFSSSYGVTFYAINTTTGINTISDNTIGSTTQANSIQVTSATGSNNAVSIQGIVNTAASGAQGITGNTIANLTNPNTSGNTASVAGAPGAAGINASGAGQYSITGNNIFNLSAGTLSTTTGANAGAFGIAVVSANTAGTTVSNNTVHSISSTNTGAGAYSTLGIYIGVTGASTANNYSRNIVHSLNNASTGTTSVIAGIQLIAASSAATLSNNMIRLGINAAGSSVATNNYIAGIEDNSTTAQNYYFNTVFVGGTVTSGAINSYAFRRVAASGADLVQNNIFANDRSGGTGLHFAFASNTLAGYTAIGLDYNIYYAKNNTEFSINGTTNLSAATTTALRLQAFRANTTLGHDLHSGIGKLTQINFANYNGNATNVSLNLGANNCAVGAGLAITLYTSDYAGNPRAAIPAIGAHESGFNSMLADNDIYTPNFSFTNIPAQGACGGSTNIVVDVTITDIGTAVPTTGSVPVIWFRRSAPTTTTWAPTSGVLQSGNGNSGVWRFTVPQTLAVGETYQYYFVADDQATNQALNTPGVNRWYSSYDATTPVVTLTTQTTQPTTVSSFATNPSTPISGTVTVGTLGTYATFNGNTSSALFYDLFQKGLSGNLTVKVISDVSELANYWPLTAPTEYCGSNYTITIRPDTNTLRTVASNTFGANPLIELNGVKRVIIDGRNSGSGSYLRFRQASTQTTIPPTFYFVGNAQNITIQYCTIEGNNNQLTTATTIGAGVVNFAGPLGSGLAIKDITLDNNIIRNRSDLTQSSANTPYSLVQMGQSNGTSTPVKSRIVISNNELLNFKESAIQVRQNTSFAGIGDSIIITGNKVYMPIAMPTYTYPIWLEGGTNTKKHVISNNIIGGNAAPNPGLNGTWSNSLTDGEIVGIYTLNGGTSLADGINISGNTIGNMTLTGTTYTNLIGIRNEFGYATIQNNTITTMNNNGGGSVAVTDNTANIGIWNQDDNEVLIDGNTITNWTTLGITTRFLYMIGIEHGSNQYHNGVDYTNNPGGKATVTNNTISNLYCGSGLQSVTLSPDALIGIFVFPANGSTGNSVSSNTISGLRATLTNVYNTRVYGIGVGLGGYGATCTGSVSKNKIYDLNNTGGGTSTEINGMVTAGGNWTVSNNMVSITNSVYPTKYPSITGILDWMANGRTGAFYNNSVYIGGTVASPGANSSYAYCRIPDGTATVLGANLTIRNNLFFNDRSGNSTNNMAIGNLTTGNSADAATGWNSNYNLLLARDANMIGRWIGTPANNKSFPNWLSSSSGDGNSWSVVTTTSSSSNTQVNASDLFNNTTTGDLTIKTANQAAWFVNGKGVSGSQVGSLATDYNGTTRGTTYGYGIDIGADEFDVDNGNVPHTLTGTPTLGGTTTFNFAGRTVASVDWGSVGTVPTSVNCTYYSGNDPGSVGTAYLATNKANFVYEITASGGSGFTYAANLNYDPALLGTYAASESTMRLVKTRNNWFDEHASLNTTTKVMSSVNTLNSFSWFTGGQANEPLPITLLTFTAKPVDKHVDLHWVTASEINNDYFTVERSLDAVHFEPISIIQGAGNSNTTLTYTDIDVQPYDGLSYYRLKQTDFDGQYSYSDIRPVLFSNSTFGIVRSYVNSDGQIELWVNNSANEQSSLSILDIQGKLIGTQNQELTKGINKIVFANSVAQGIYLIRVQTSTNDATVKILK